MKQITTIIFDLGRVLVRIHASGQKFGLLMRSIGITQEEAFSEFWYDQDVRRYMTGDMTPAQFHTSICNRFSLDLSFEDFSQAWCDIFEPFGEMEEFFTQLSGQYTMGLLSDTDPLHWEKVRTMLPCLKTVAKPTLSFEVGYLKPHPNMFSAAADNCGCKKRECLFIDDLIANVDGARYFGMQAVQFTGLEKLRKDLSDLEII